MGHRHVVRLVWHFVEQLLVADHGDQACLRIPQDQRAVIEATAAAESRTGAVDSQGRNKHDTGLGDGRRRQPGPGRLEQPEPRRHQLSGPVFTPLQRHRVVVCGGPRHRQQHPVGVTPQHIQQFDGSRLSTDRDVGAHRAAVDYQRGNMTGQGGGLLGPVAAGHRTAGAQQPFSQCGLALGRHKVNDMVSTMATSPNSVPRTAIVPAAGLGTRFLPATKTVPKELLPVVDTPGIELVAAEAAGAGAERLVIITSEGKDGVVAHFVEDLVLEGTLVARGKDAMLAKVRRAPALIKVESVVQTEPLGLGHAISCVEPVLWDDEDAVAILLPDDLVLPTGVLETMSKVRAQYGGSVLCAIEVSPEEISSYGVFDVEPVPGADKDVLKVNGMVEKPKAENAPSLYAAAGRYVLDRAIFEALHRIQRGVGGEMQLTDAIALLIKEGHPVHVVVHRGSRHDLGNPGGYLKAAVDFALDRDDYGPDLRRWLVTRLGLAEG
jgi:UTP--glucose-1-phosphate uridylyltransferase